MHRKSCQKPARQQGQLRRARAVLGSDIGLAALRYGRASDTSSQEEEFKMRRNITTVVVIAMAVFIFAMSAQAQKSRAAVIDKPFAQEPLYTDFRGVKLGMTPEDVRAKLGNPVVKDAEMDYFVLGDTVTAQVVYDAAHKVKMISVDYANGTGAPDYHSVVGNELTTKPDGSAYAMVRYESRGFWVSYNRTAGTVTVVTVTIQKI